MTSLWKRLQRRDKWPRRWWHPAPPPKLKVSDEKLLDAHKEASITIRRSSRSCSRRPNPTISKRSFKFIPT
jgi:hypothetical protein